MVKPAEGMDTMPNSAFRNIAKAFGNMVSWLVYLAGLLVCLAALGCWAFQWYIWLQKGTWLSLPLSKYVTFDSAGWVGLDQVAAFLLNVNVGYPLLIGGILLMALSLVRI
jgi:hypothetical protein